MNKFRAWEHRATDKAASKGVTSKKKQSYENVLARLSSCGAYLSKLFSGATHNAAVQEAKRVHAVRADSLTTFGLAKWLDGDDGFGSMQAREQEQRDLFVEMLREQEIFLEEKLAAYDGFRASFLETEELTPAIQKTFIQVSDEVRADAFRLQKINVLLANEQPVALNHLKREFLRLQGFETVELPDEDASSELNAQLAQYLTADLSDELTTIRGILFDMHRRSFHLQHEFQVA